MSLIKIHFCVITVLQLSLLLLKATVVMYCDYNDRPCLSMFSIKCFKTNKGRHQQKKKRFLSGIAE